MTKIVKGALDAEIDRLARVPQLLVASDFDGTLSDLAPQPDQARAVAGAAAALDALAALPRTWVAIVSGRSLGDLDLVADFPATIERIGSHGLEPSDGAAVELDVRAQLRHNRLRCELETLAAATPGSRVEVKPYSVAFHYRHVDAARAERALAWIDETVARRDGLWRKDGHMVAELLVLPASKSWAVDLLRSRHPESVVFFAGDDLTDEDVFADLRPGDVAVKVGEGPSLATHRVADPAAVVALVTELASRRAAITHI